MLISDLVLSKKEIKQDLDREKEINVYRILLLLCSTFTITLRYLFVKEFPAAFDPLSIRVVFSGMLLLVFLLTLIQSINRIIVYLNYLVFTSYSLYGVVLILKNNFGISYILELIILIVIICLAFKNNTHINIYLSVVFTAYAIASFIYLPDLVDVFVYISLLGIFCGAILVFFDSKIEAELDLRIREDLLNTVFNESPDALFLIDPSNSLIINCNDRSLSMFDLIGQEKIIGNNLNYLMRYPYSPGAWKNLKKKVGQKRFLIQEVEFKTTGNRIFWGSQAITEISVDNSVYWLVRISDITERVNDKKTIEENRKMLRQVVDLVPHQIFLKDNQGRFVLVNKAVADLYETTAEEMIGKRDTNYAGDIFTQKVIENDLEVMERGKGKIVPEELMTDKNGVSRILNTIRIPFYLDEENKPGVLGIAMDVTEEKLNEQAIKESETKYRTLMEQASDGIYVSDRAGNILDVNLKACDMFGYSMEEFLKLNIKKLVDPIGFPDSMVRVPDNNDRQSIIVERRFVKKDGVAFTVELSVKLLDDGSHQAIMRDITERKKVERILKDNERKFRALIENSSDIIIILSENFTIKYVSPSVKRILGVDPDKLLNTTIFELSSPEGIDRLSIFLSDILSNPGENHFLEEIKINAHDNGFIYTEVVGANLLVDPIINGIIINCHDITVRKSTEKELLNTNFELDSFVYKASHDLKAPLRSIMGLIKLAKIESKDERQQLYLDMMNKSVLSLDQFIKDLTQFSRNSRMEVEAKKINFEEIINESLGNLKFMENGEKIEIHKKLIIPSNFYSDLTRLSTIFNNLISNAFKYHRFENNNPYINIEIEADREKVKIVVEDNGQGIDLLYVDRIFEMFYRASESSYGSGLGLYIVKNAVQKLNGKISVQSVVNQGTKFIVVIPNLINKAEKNEG